MKQKPCEIVGSTYTTFLVIDSEIAVSEMEYSHWGIEIKIIVFGL